MLSEFKKICISVYHSRLRAEVNSQPSKVDKTYF